MNNQIFSLQPFPSDDILPDIKIKSAIAFKNNILDISYTLVGNLADVIIPPPSNTPVRQHKLWQDTCFEFFFGIQNSPAYWEFNLSPAGHWNVYRFKDYRQGMQEEIALRILPFSIQSYPDALSLVLNLDLTAIISVDYSLEVAITTVTKHNDGKVRYWALTHTGSEADFHRRDSFISIYD